MKIKKNTVTVGCDIGCCKNIAEFYIEFDGATRADCINICKNCLGKLSTFANAMKKKEQNEVVSDDNEKKLQ